MEPIDLAELFCKGNRMGMAWDVASLGRSATPQARRQPPEHAPSPRTGTAPRTSSARSAHVTFFLA